jgi:hypothetical protein
VACVHLCRDAAIAAHLATRAAAASACTARRTDRACVVACAAVCEVGLEVDTRVIAVRRTRIRAGALTRHACAARATSTSACAAVVIAALHVEAVAATEHRAEGTRAVSADAFLPVGATKSACAAVLGGVLGHRNAAADAAIIDATVAVIVAPVGAVLSTWRSTSANACIKAVGLDAAPAGGTRRRPCSARRSADRTVAPWDAKAEA